MNEQLILFIALLICHWIADFICQSHWMATNKSKDNIALTLHILTYISVFAVFSLFLLNFTNISSIFCFLLVNFVLHFITDYITSRETSKLWKSKNIHNFFVLVGLDQLIHQVTLAGTMYYFFFK